MHNYAIFWCTPILNVAVHCMRAWHVPAYAAAQFCFKLSALRSCLSMAKQGGGKTRNKTRQLDKVGICFITFISGGNDIFAVFVRQSQRVMIVSTRHQPPLITCSTGNRACFFFKRVKWKSSAWNLGRNERMLELPSARLTTSIFKC